MENKEYKRKLIKKAYNYGLDVISLIDNLNSRYFSVQVLSKQLLRSATSVGANIIEAQAASSKKDFINFLNHALKSANESKFWLGMLKDSKKVNNARAKSLIQETDELAKMLGSSIFKLRKK